MMFFCCVFTDGSIKLKTCWQNSNFLQDCWLVACRLQKLLHVLELFSYIRMSRAGTCNYLLHKGVVPITIEQRHITVWCEVFYISPQPSNFLIAKQYIVRDFYCSRVGPNAGGCDFTSSSPTIEHRSPPSHTCHLFLRREHYHHVQK